MIKYIYQQREKLIKRKKPETTKAKMRLGAQKSPTIDPFQMVVVVRLLRYILGKATGKNILSKDHNQQLLNARLRTDFDDEKGIVFSFGEQM